jgi:predicted  nucleic acid-binding Zn-ribbon protein
MENNNTTSSSGQFSGSNPARNTSPLPPPVPPGGRGTLPPPTPPQPKGRLPKVLLAIIIILAVALIASVVYIYQFTKQSEEDLAIAVVEKQEVIADLEKLKVDYGELRVGNDTLNAQIDTERKKIEALMERIKKTEASNRTKIRQYEREITNLKSLLTGYVHQIDSLNVLNRALRDENTKVKSEINQSKKQVEELSQEKTALKSMVEKGGELKVRDITAVALTSRDKTASRARQTEQFKVCLALIENNIAKRGSRNVYIRIKSPDGSLLTQSVTNLFNPIGGGAQLIYSAMREVDYNGEDLEVCVYYKDKDFLSGSFDIEVFLDGAFMGSTQLILK